MKKIAVFPGDGIGPEVINAGMSTLLALREKYGLDIEFKTFPWASCEYFMQHGQMMPDDWSLQLIGFDAIYFGAVGNPDLVPDHISLWHSILLFRRVFDLYVNLRPVKTFKGLEGPLKSREDIDYLIVRENTEGEYSELGGIMYPGTEREVATQTSVFSRFGCDRILHFAFLEARRRKGKLVLATKSNGIAISMPYWDQRARIISQAYPEVSLEKVHIDALAARFVSNPESLDVVVASNLFGDILSDLGSALTGSLGLAASACINPERKGAALFEPVHGSALDIAGKDVANPIAAIWSAALMLNYLGDCEGSYCQRYRQAAKDLEGAIEKTLQGDIKTLDLGGKASCQEMTKALLSHIRS